MKFSIYLNRRFFLTVRSLLGLLAVLCGPVLMFCRVVLLLFYVGPVWYNDHLVGAEGAGTFAFR